MACQAHDLRPRAGRQPAVDAEVDVGFLQLVGGHAGLLDRDVDVGAELVADRYESLGGAVAGAGTESTRRGVDVAGALFDRFQSVGDTEAEVVVRVETDDGLGLERRPERSHALGGRRRQKRAG